MPALPGIYLILIKTQNLVFKAELHLVCQIVDIHIVCIEGGSVHLRQLADIRDSHLLQGSVLQKLHEGIFYPPPGLSAPFVVGCVHLALSIISTDV